MNSIEKFVSYLESVLKEFERYTKYLLASGVGCDENIIKSWLCGFMSSF